MDRSLRFRLDPTADSREATEVLQEASFASHKLSARRSGVRGAGVFLRPQAFRLYLSTWLWSPTDFPLYVKAREMKTCKAPLGFLPRTRFDAEYHGVMADFVNEPRRC